MTGSNHADGTDEAPVRRPVEVLYVTDPICSHCWAMEPAWRRFLHHYGDLVEVKHLYGGLLPGWEGFNDSAGISEPADLPPHWEEVAERYGQPIDASVWYRDPLPSSSPPSVAMHALRAIAPEREDDYLRRLRQALFLEARNIARPEVMIDCAADIGVDGGALATALDDTAHAAAFDRDRRTMREMGLRSFPTLVVRGPASPEPRVMRGSQPFFRLQRALEAMIGDLPPDQDVAVKPVLHAYGTGTTREFSEVLQLEPAETEEALRSAGARARSLAGSHLWSVGSSGPGVQS